MLAKSLKSVRDWVKDCWRFENEIPTKAEKTKAMKLKINTTMKMRLNKYFLSYFKIFDLVHIVAALQPPTVNILFIEDISSFDVIFGATSYKFDEFVLTS